MLYLKHFETDSSRLDYEEEEIAEKNHVSYSIESDAAYIRTEKKYLTFKILTDGTVNFVGTTGVVNNQNIVNTIEYSFDGGKTWSGGTSSVTLNVLEGDIVKWRGHMQPIDKRDERYHTPEIDSGIGKFSGGTAKFDLKYDIMSLLHGDDYETNTDMIRPCTFAYLFSYSNVVDAKFLNLQSLNLTDACYGEMFLNCPYLYEAPYLLGKNIKPFCYFEMFMGCESLEKCPALISEKLETSCYQRTFSGCKSLKKAPELLSTQLAQSCYESMFSNCTSLIEPPTLPATTLAVGCYISMFKNCTSLTYAPELNAINIPSSAYTEMFSNCTSLTEAPTLPATTLQSRCYRLMFNGCTSLTTPPQISATSVPSSGFMEMFAYCTSLTKAPELLPKTLTNQCYEKMFIGCSSLKEIKIHATDIRASNCLNNWVKDVSSSGDFYYKQNTTYSSGSSGKPDGWDSHTF